MRPASKSSTLLSLVELGIYVIVLALFYGSLGIILFFDRGLLAFSNVRCFPVTALSTIAFVFGRIPARHGTQSECHVLLKPIKVSTAVVRYCESLIEYRIPQTAAFFAGIVLLLLGWTFVGFFVEIFGFFFLYKYAFVRNQLSE